MHLTTTPKRNLTWANIPYPDGTFPRKVVYQAWEKWFAWYPVNVHGQRTWLKTVYRRKINTYVDMENWSRYDYGTIFDVLTD